MNDTILTYAKMLQDASAAGIDYLDEVFEDGMSPASLTDAAYDLLLDEVRAGRMTQREAEEFAHENLPY